jgi:nickel-dependent lactate racemase
MRVELADFDVSVDVRDADCVSTRRSASAPNVDDVGAAVRDALDRPHKFPPLRRALTPDDQIAVVVDERLPQLGAVVSEVLAYVVETGIDPAAITLVGAPGSLQPWVDDLPDQFQNVRTEIHDPAERKAVAYLASTRKGRRVYLNRTVVDADQAIVVAGCRYDPAFGRVDGAGALFPALSDADSIKDANRFFSMAAPDAAQWPLREEAAEIAWLLGVPFLLHLIEGAGDGVSAVVGGTVEAASECQRLLDERWRVSVPRPAQTVIASLGGDPSRHDFEGLARAALGASRVVEPNGRIVLLSRAHPKLGESIELMSGTDNPAVASRRVQERLPADRTAALQWLEAARQAGLYLLSELPDDTVEEMFATPLQQARQVQRLLDVPGSCLFLDEADKMLAVVET